MNLVRISATLEPDDDEIDANDGTGLTQEAHDKLLDGLMALGLSDIEITRA